MSTLVDFLASGNFAGIRLYSSKEEVRKVLGEPENISVQKNPEYWEYGALGLSFVRDKKETESKLRFLLIDFTKDDKNLPESGRFEDWSPNQETTLEEFEAYLKSNSFNEFERQQKNGWISLIMPSGLIVEFQEGQLFSITLTAKEKPKGKRISVFIPQETLELLKREAQERKQSVSEICSEWIVERANSVQTTSH